MFASLPNGKSTGPNDIKFFFYISPLNSLNLALTPDTKLNGQVWFFLFRFDFVVMRNISKVEQIRLLKIPCQIFFC